MQRLLLRGRQGPDPLVVRRVEVEPVLAAGGHAGHLVETVVLVDGTVPTRQVARRVVGRTRGVQAVRGGVRGNVAAYRAGDGRQVAVGVEGVALLLGGTASRWAVEEARRDEAVDLVVGEGRGADRLDVSGSVVGVGARVPGGVGAGSGQRRGTPHLVRIVALGFHHAVAVRHLADQQVGMIRQRPVRDAVGAHAGQQSLIVGERGVAGGFRVGYSRSTLPSSSEPLLKQSARPHRQQIYKCAVAAYVLR